MSGSACVVFDDSLTEYDFGPGHPMAPLRVDLTMRLARSLEVVGGKGLAQVPAPVADEDVLALVHSERYIEAVRRAGANPDRLDLAHGLGTEDNPTFPRMHEATAHVVGASVEAARRVWEGEAVHAANISGGLHHAMRDWASGFCVYNDPAIAIAWLLGKGARKIAYVDVDVHHGDGVQQAFYDDPRVLTVSLHETPRTLFPGTGLPEESGGEGAEGSAVNIALPPGTSDSGWLRAFHAVVPPLLREFDPDIIVSQQGCDSHIEDPLAHLMLTVDGQCAAYKAVHDLAHELCDGRWVAVGGGGYAIVDVVPRAWSHLLAVVAGRPVEPTTETPQEWRDHVQRQLGRVGPRRMTDGRTPEYRDWSEGYDPDSWLDRSIQATRAEIFPSHGIDPLY
ncbi:MAG: acetoin utilization protein AcuC [Nocardioidaceae bacterium]